MTMLPRLQAEERLATAEAVGLGAGAVDRHAARRRLSELERQAAGGEVARADPSTEQGRAMLATMGIGVEVADV